MSNAKVGKAMKHQMDVITTLPVSNAHIGIFRQVYRPRKGPSKKRPSNVYVFYFVSIKGSNPPSHDIEWYKHVIDYLDLTHVILNYQKRSIDSNIDSSLRNKR